MDLGRLFLRGVVGSLFVGHGTQKLFGWFGGHGLEGTAGFFEGLGLRPGRRHATAAGINEAGGGLLLALGAATPVAATMISATMLTAMRKVHLAKGPWVTQGGYEYNLALIAAMTALVETGPGRASVDAALFPRWKGAGWALASLAAAGAGTYLATGPLTEPEPEPEAEPHTMTDEERAAQPRFQRETSDVAASPTA
jgi:putative oxidoreductase